MSISLMLLFLFCKHKVFQSVSSYPNPSAGKRRKRLYQSITHRDVWWQIQVPLNNHQRHLQLIQGMNKTVNQVNICIILLIYQNSNAHFMTTHVTVY